MNSFFTYEKRRRTCLEKFTSKESRLLVELMENKECLWNHNSEDYKNREVKENSWVEVARDLGHNMEDVKIYWNNIRSRYVFERKKVLATKNDINTYKPKFELYDQLSFLNEVCASPGKKVKNRSVEIEFCPTIDGSLSPIPSFSHKNSDKEDTPVPKKIIKTVPPMVMPDLLQRNAVLNELSKFIRSPLPDQPDNQNHPSTMDKWIVNFGEFISHELDSYDKEEAIELKHEITAVCLNFRRSRKNKQ